LFFCTDPFFSSTAQGKVLNDFYESTAGKILWVYAYIPLFCLPDVLVTAFITCLFYLVHCPSSFMFVQGNFKLMSGKLGQQKLSQEERIG
jgi:hypothetical protein